MRELKSFLTTIGKSLEQELPYSDYDNPLDKRRRDLRKRELQSIKDDVFRMKRDLADSKSERKMEIVSTIVDKLNDHLSRIKYLCIEVIIAFHNLGRGIACIFLA